jgi:outer membrane protein OmpA-like peptidoglycan-associated protein
LRRYLIILITLISCNNSPTKESENISTTKSEVVDNSPENKNEPESKVLENIFLHKKTIRLNHNINTSSNEICATLSPDKTKLYFSGLDRTGFFDFKLDFTKNSNSGGEDIFFSKLSKHKIWEDSRPVNFLNTDAHETINQVLTNGKLLLTGSYPENIGFSNKPGANTTDLFIATPNNDSYSIYHFPEPVNSLYTEADPYLKENKFIVFVSDRPNKNSVYHKKGWSWNESMWGNTDIWVSLYENYMWQEPINLGPIVNSEFSERSPWLSDDGLTLYLSSNGYEKDKKDLDVYVFKRDDVNNWENWEGPYLLNDTQSPSDEIYFKIYDDEIYFSRGVKNNYKSSINLNNGIRETNFRTGYNVTGQQIGSYQSEYNFDIFTLIDGSDPILTIENVNFKFNSSELAKESHVNLKYLADLIKINNPMEIKLHGFTDNIGTPEYNMKLSIERATQVKNYLKDSCGIINQIEIIGNGEEKPLAPNNNNNNRSKNRRVEIYFN